MGADKMSLESSFRVAGAFMTLAGLVGGVLVLFVLPGNSYLTGVILLMLAILLISGLITLTLGLLLTYRRAIGRAMAMPAIIISRLIGRG